MSTEPVDDRYPEAWRPAWAPEFDEPEPEPKPEPLAMELHVAAMTDEEFESFIRRARPGRS